MDRARNAKRKPIIRYPFTLSFATGIAVPPLFFSPIILGWSTLSLIIEVVKYI
jgi:hypothetical protein